MDPWDEVIRRITPDLQAAEAELRDVTRRVEGLRFAIKYAEDAKADALTQHAATLHEAAPVETGSLGVGVTGAGPGQLCEEVLREAGGDALKTQVVRERVNTASGQDFSPEQIKSALSYLNRKKRVEKVGVALWRIPQATVPSQDFTPTVGTVGVSQTGENGWSGRPDVLTGAGA